MVVVENEKGFYAIYIHSIHKIDKVCRDLLLNYINPVAFKA